VPRYGAQEKSSKWPGVPGGFLAAANPRTVPTVGT